MSPRRTSSATSRRPSKRRTTTTTTSSRRTRKSRTARGSSRKRSTDGARAPRSSPVLVYLGLGSNLGSERTKRARLTRALVRIAGGSELIDVSSFYRTEPVGFRDQPDFLNAVAKILWRGSPEELLAFVKRIESDLGRVPRFVDGPREIDVDILDFGGRVRRAQDPILPHPRMRRRRFVLAPLAEIAPRWRHPVTRETARSLLASLPAAPGVVRLPESPRVALASGRQRPDD